MPSNEFLLLYALIAVLPVFYLIQVARRKKDRIRFKLKRMVVSVMCYLLGIIVAQKTGHSLPESVIFGVLLGLTASCIFVRPPDRNRRAVVARDLKGVPFDLTIHHIDHIVRSRRVATTRSGIFV